ncbi:hypothetical protein HK102_005645, partial [Quaeritorhiza haematococci]
PQQTSVEQGLPPRGFWRRLKRWIKRRIQRRERKQRKMARCKITDVGVEVARPVSDNLDGVDLVEKVEERIDAAIKRAEKGEIAAAAPDEEYQRISEVVEVEVVVAKDLIESNEDADKAEDTANDRITEGIDGHVHPVKLEIKDSGVVLCEIQLPTIAEEGEEAVAEEVLEDVFRVGPSALKSNYPAPDAIELNDNVVEIVGMDVLGTPSSVEEQTPRVLGLGEALENNSEDISTVDAEEKGEVPLETSAVVGVSTKQKSVTPRDTTVDDANAKVNLPATKSEIEAGSSGGRTTEVAATVNEEYGQVVDEASAPADQSAVLSTLASEDKQDGLSTKNSDAQAHMHGYGCASEMDMQIPESTTTEGAQIIYAEDQTGIYIVDDVHVDDAEIIDDAADAEKVDRPGAETEAEVEAVEARKVSCEVDECRIIEGMVGEVSPSKLKLKKMALVPSKLQLPTIQEEGDEEAEEDPCNLVVETASAKGGDLRGVSCVLRSTERLCEVVVVDDTKASKIVAAGAAAADKVQTPSIVGIAEDAESTNNSVVIDEEEKVLPSNDGTARDGLAHEEEQKADAELTGTLEVQSTPTVTTSASEGEAREETQVAGGPIMNSSPKPVLAQVEPEVDFTSLDLAGIWALIDCPTTSIATLEKLERVLSARTWVIGGGNVPQRNKIFYCADLDARRVLVESVDLAFRKYKREGAWAGESDQYWMRMTLISTRSIAAPHKSVVVRYTTDGWQTLREASAAFETNTLSSHVDRYVCDLDLDEVFADAIVGAEYNLEFAVRHETQWGEVAWDNKGGENFKVGFAVATGAQLGRREES